MQSLVPTLYGLSVCSFIIGGMYVSGALSGSDPTAVPISLLFTFLGMITAFVAIELKNLNKKIEGDQLAKSESENKEEVS